jgi:hypothetical protein
MNRITRINPVREFQFPHEQGLSQVGAIHELPLQDFFILDLKVNHL